MLIQKFQRKPFPVEGVRVTKENMQEVAEWCKGEVKVSGKKTKYIFIATHRPMTDRQTQAYIGDWILFAERGYKIYTQNAFARNFELVEAGTGKDHADFVPEDKGQLEFEITPGLQVFDVNVTGERKLASPSDMQKLVKHFQDGNPGRP